MRSHPACLTVLATLATLVSATAFAEPFDVSDVHGRYFLHLAGTGDGAGSINDAAPSATVMNMEMEGTLTFDGAGGVTGARRVYGQLQPGTVARENGSPIMWTTYIHDGLYQPLHGTYAVDADGRVTLELDIESPAVIRDMAFNGGTLPRDYSQQPHERHVLWLSDGARRLDGHAYFQTGTRLLDDSVSWTWTHRFGETMVSQEAPPCSDGAPLLRFGLSR